MEALKKEGKEDDQLERQLENEEVKFLAIEEKNKEINDSFSLLLKVLRQALIPARKSIYDKKIKSWLVVQFRSINSEFHYSSTEVTRLQLIK